MLLIKRQTPSDRYGANARPTWHFMPAACESPAPRGPSKGGPRT